MRSRKRATGYSSRWSVCRRGSRAGRCLRAMPCPRQGKSAGPASGCEARVASTGALACRVDASTHGRRCGHRRNGLQGVRSVQGVQVRGQLRERDNRIGNRREHLLNRRDRVGNRRWRSGQRHHRGRNRPEDIRDRCHCVRHRRDDSGYRWRADWSRAGPRSTPMRPRFIGRRDHGRIGRDAIRIRCGRAGIGRGGVRSVVVAARCCGNGRCSRRSRVS